MRAVIAGLDLLLLIALILLLARLVLEWIRSFARDWRPRGAALVLAEGVYTVTDPPVRAARRIIPPLRFGGITLDTSLLALLALIWLGQVLLSLWVRNL